MITRDVIRACLGFGTRFYTLADLAGIVAAPRDSLLSALWKLQTGGFITRVRYHTLPKGPGPGRRPINPTYRNRQVLRRKVEPRKGRKGNTWDRLWKAARIMRRFSTEGLASVTGTTRSNAVEFLRVYRKQEWVRHTGRGVWVFAKSPPVSRPPYSGRGAHE